MEPFRDSKVFNNFIINYWNYYLDLENDFLSTKKYVDFNKANFNSFSMEYLKLLQAVCSEVEVVGKMMAKYVDPTFDIENSKSIMNWLSVVKNAYFLSEVYYSPMNPSSKPCTFKIYDYECHLIGEIVIHPWNVCDGETPEWWNSYNKVKHRRDNLNPNTGEAFYSQANFKNVSYAFAGLYVLEKAFMDSVGTKDDLEAFANYSKLFVKRENITSKEIDEILKLM